VYQVINGIHHVGISVSDLDRSIEFYCEILGMEMLGQASFGGEIMDHITGLTGTRGHSAMLRAGAQHLELFEFAAPAAKPNDHLRPVCDHGISHFCMEVRNIQVEYERLKVRGVEFHCPPQPFGNMRATYARDPDGNVFELLEAPGRV
jgi:catechol 2,3-dioxygenase-like lactoylglutathione lyase family enzyme